MILFVISMIYLALVLLFLRSVGKVYAKRNELGPGEYAPLKDLPLVSIIVPARNEEVNIENCLRSLIKQSYPPERYEIITVDDGSSDNTPAIVQRIHAEDARVALINPGELPDGWGGKNHACWKGTERARGDWYCFIDADTVSNPDLLKSAVSFAVARGIDMLSINPFQLLVTGTERLLLPAVFLSIASTMDFDKVNDPSRTESGANGQFMLFRRSVYEAVKGHYAVRSEIMEDMAFASLVKSSGFRLFWIFGDKLIHTRMYRGLSHIWEGLSKNLTEIMKDRGIRAPVLRAAESFIMAWAPIILPIITWIWLQESPHSPYTSWAFGISLATSGALFIFFLLTLKALKTPLLYIMAFPLGFSFSSALTLRSLFLRRKGRRMWKGRIYQ